MKRLIGVLCGGMASFASVKARFTVAAACVALLPSGLSAQGIITTVAGGGPMDGTPALSAGIPRPTGIAKDGFGNLYFSSYWTGQIYKVNGSGGLTLLAGACNGQPTPVGACLLPNGLATDSSGDLFFADIGSSVVRRIDRNTGTMTTVAGGGSFESPGDGGAATQASLSVPYDVAVDGAGNLFIADTFNHRIRRVDAATGIITTAAGTGTGGFNGDEIAATSAELYFPAGVAVDSTGNLWIADYTNGRVRRVDASTGFISTVAMGAPTAIAVDAAGNAYFTDQFGALVRKVEHTTFAVTTITGSGSSGFSGDGGQALAASLDLSGFSGLESDASGNVWLADTNNFRIREILSSTGVILTVVGTGSPGDGGPATRAHLARPLDVAVDSSGNVFVPDQFNLRVRRIDKVTGFVGTVAGGGPSNSGFVCYGACGDGGSALGAVLNGPSAVALDSSGNLFIADFGVIRRVDATTGVITTVAGGGLSEDDGPATSASLSCCALGIALDPSGNLLIADYNHHRVRRVDISSGIITTIAGNGIAGFNGDGVSATTASLNFPFFVTVDIAGNVLIADTFNQRIRRLDAGTGLISTVAGTGAVGFHGSNGDEGAATMAQLSYPLGLAMDTAGNLFIGESCGVRRIDAATGVITTVAGGACDQFSGDGGPATSAGVSPRGIAVDHLGDLYIADAFNNRIRKVTLGDTTPPDIDPHADLVVEATGPSGAIVTYTPPATHDAVDGDGTATCGPASGSTFGLGRTVVECAAQDAAGNSSSSSFEVSVRDTTAPAISTLTPAIGVLRRNTFTVTIAIGVTDAVDAAPMCMIADVTRSARTEPERDDDRTPPAWVITGPMSVILRGTGEGVGRHVVYTIGIACTDAAGNRSTVSTTVSTPLRKDDDDKDDESDEEHRQGKNDEQYRNDHQKRDDKRDRRNERTKPGR